MRKLKHFWSALESVSTLTLPVRQWEELLGPDFDFGWQFLRSTGHPTEWLPCQTRGRHSCSRRVLPDHRGGFIAVCEKEPKECSTVAVDREDLIEHALRVEGLAGAISKAMGLKGGCERHPHVRGAWGLGRGFDPEHERAEVFLALPNPSVELRAVVVEILSATEGPVIVAAPTTRGCDLLTRQLLGREGYGLVVLEDLLACEGRTLRMRQPAFRIELPQSWRPSEGVRENVFRPFGQTWEIAYNGKPVTLTPRVGAFYIWEILKARPTPIGARTLLGARPEVPDGVVVSATGGVDEAVDAQALQACRRQLLSLDAELEMPGVQDDPARKLSVQREIRDIQSYITASTGLGGRIRLMENDNRKIANAISSALGRAYTAIRASEHPELAQHLRTFIQRRDLEFSYQAPPEIEWRTE